MIPGGGGGPNGLYDLNPDSPGGGMLHHHPQYPFSDLRHHPGVGPGIGHSDFPGSGGGGRMSPATAMRLSSGDGNGFNYPGQEWPTEYPSCGPMPGYFPGMYIAKHKISKHCIPKHSIAKHSVAKRGKAYQSHSIAKQSVP